MQPTGSETIIHPVKQKLWIEHTYGPVDFQTYRDLIGCSMITFVRLYDNGDGVYLDDEGLYADPQHFWMHRNYPQPLCNKGVFIGVDDEGESTVPSTPLPVLEKDIVYCGSRYDLAFMVRINGHLINTEEGYEDYRPLFF